MRIAFIAPLVSPIAEPHVGGSQAFLADLTQRLAKRGHEITLFARQGSIVPNVKIESIVVPETVLPTSFSEMHQDKMDKCFFDQANLFFELFLQIQQTHHKFDLVHVQAFDWPAFVFSKFINTMPVLQVLHLQAISTEINAALKIMHQQGHETTIATVSRACAMSYAAYTPIDHIIHNGIDMHAIPFVSTHLSDQPPLIYAGRIAPEKGVESAIHIAKLAGRKLLIVGGIYDKAYYEERILPLLSNNITYLGYLKRHELWRVVGQSVGLLFPIEWDEAFGLIPVEAMATGTPVIAFRRGAVEETILDGKTGFIVEPGDIQSAANSVDKLSSIQRSACRKHVEACFSIEKTVTAYEELYQSLLKNWKKL